MGSRKTRRETRETKSERLPEEVVGTGQEALDFPTVKLSDDRAARIREVLGLLGARMITDAQAVQLLKIKVG